MYFCDISQSILEVGWREKIFGQLDIQKLKKKKSGNGEYSQMAMMGFSLLATTL